MKIYGGVNMATNNFLYKSLADLEKLASTYKTSVVKDLAKKVDPVYTMGDISKMDFENISTFLVNAIVKDSKIIDQNESIYSNEFSELMKKYFTDSLSIDDIVQLRKFVINYNNLSFQYMVNNVGSYVFGLAPDFSGNDLAPDSSGIDPLSFIGKLITSIKNKINYLAINAIDQETKKTISEWFGGTVVSTHSKYKLSEFLVYLDTSKIVEALVILMVISYLSEVTNEGIYSVDSSGDVVYDSTVSFSKESFYIQNINKIPSIIRDFNFSNKTATVIKEPISNSDSSNKIESLIIKDDINTIILKMPLKLLNSSDVVIDVYNPITVNGTTITFLSLFSQLRTNLLNFIDLIDIPSASLTTIKGIDPVFYNFNLSYFFNTSNTSQKLLVQSMSNSVKETAATFYYKDRIIDNYYTTETETEKRSANLLEISNTQAGDQLVFIDVKGVDFSSYTTAQITELRSAFLITDETKVLGNYQPDSGSPLNNKLTYTVIYKELNPVLRSLCLIDVQEYKFSRLFKGYSYNEKTILEVNRVENISYLTSLNSLYKNYEETEEVFEIETSLRYKYLFSNMYMARISDESDIIGYYVGDNTELSSFTNNYGFYDYQKMEIQKFLEIYKVTRDYYYKVLLNKSFIQDDTYFLYEKLYIAWVAIERFLTSKIENLKDLDMLNDTDIYNFLESYGLGVLNQYDFFLGSKDYKVNIIKNFTNLNKLKGSKDVIDLLARMFDVGDVLVNINKFLLVDEVELTYDNGVNFNLSINDGDIEINNESIDIKVYDEDRIYYYNEEFVDADGEELATPTTDYMFDEENYKLYDINMVEKSFVTRSTIPSASEQGYNALTIYFNEVTELFYLGTTPKTYTNVSVVSDLPVNIATGDVFYIISKGKFYRKNNSGLEVISAAEYIPSIIEKNAGIKLDTQSLSYARLRKYDGFIFYTGSSATNNLELKRYIFLNNRLLNVTFRILNDFPKEKYTINVPWKRILIKTGRLTSTDIERKTSMLYYYKDGNLNNDKVFLELDNYFLNYFNYDLSKDLVLTLQKSSKEDTPEFKFIEVPYISDNGSREINNNLGIGTKYNSFLEINEFEKIDPYWTKENVPSELLREIGLDAVETKYLSLIISENIYKQYVISRYVLSTIEYLDTFLFSEDSNSIVDKIEIESGLFSRQSLYNYYNIIKVLFKTVLRLFSERIEGSVPTTNSSFVKYYGLNPSTNWSFLETYLSDRINNFDLIKNEFLKDIVSVNSNGSSPEEYNKFNIYKKKDPAEFINFGNALFYKKDSIDGSSKVLNNVSSILANSLFSTHKLNSSISQQNSGQYVLELLENLNWIRISGSSSNSTKNQNMFSYFLSKYYDISYLPSGDFPSGGVDRSNIYFQIIEKIIKFPIDMIDGLLHESFLRENINRNKDFIDLATGIFENVYMVNAVNGKDPAFVTPVSFASADVNTFLEQALNILNNGTNNGESLDVILDSELDELILNYSEKLIAILGSLESIFSAEVFMQIQFSLKDNEQKTLDFVKQAIELFLSYTSQLYSSKFVKEYKTVSESPLFSESIKHKLTQTRTDYVLYDEKLEIKEV
jgi:hypothetical protein